MNPEISQSKLSPGALLKAQRKANKEGLPSYYVQSTRTTANGLTYHTLETYNQAFKTALQGVKMMMPDVVMRKAYCDWLLHALLKGSR